MSAVRSALSVPTDSYNAIRQWARNDQAWVTVYRQGSQYPFDYCPEHAP